MLPERVPSRSALGGCAPRQLATTMAEVLRERTEGSPKRYPRLPHDLALPSQMGGGISGDGGNRTHVRDRVKMASTSVAGALVSSPARLAGRVAGDQPPSFPRLGGGGPHRVSLLSDPGLPRRRRTGAETSRLSYELSGEGVLVRVRTYGFPGVLRGLPGPRLATIPTSQPRRSLSSPGMFCVHPV